LSWQTLPHLSPKKNEDSTSNLLELGKRVRAWLDDAQTEAAHDALSAQFGIAAQLGRTQRATLLGLHSAGASWRHQE
jgi:hypothetical protein